MRLFVGIALPQDIRFRLSLLCCGLPNIRWVQPENMHLTLRFIGEVGDDGARRIEAAAREALEEAGVAVDVGEPLQVASNFHEPGRPTIGAWFAATLCDPSAAPVAGDDAVEAAWFDPASPPPLAFPNDAVLLARLAGG